MIILLLLIILLLIVLFMRIRIQIFLSVNDLEYYYCFNIFIFKMLVAKIDKKDVKSFLNKNKQKIKNNKKNIKFLKIVRKINFEKMYINVKVGLIEIMPTIFVVPLLSTLISNICAFLKVKKFDYKIMPSFNELKLQTKMELELSFRIIDLLLA